MPAKISETKPTHEQAQLQLQLYEERRETRLREARDWFSKNYFVSSMEDSMRIAAPPESPAPLDARREAAITLSSADSNMRVPALP